MTDSSVTPPADPTTREPATAAAEITALRARVAELEAQLSEQARATNALVASSQEKLYWLERWHLDLDAIMRRRGARASLEGLRSARGVFRKARAAKRRAAARR